MLEFDKCASDAHFFGEHNNQVILRVAYVQTKPKETILQYQTNKIPGISLFESNGSSWSSEHLPIFFVNVVCVQIPSCLC